MLGFQSYWEAKYADELANFREHGHAGEVWFGPDVMETIASWTKSLCTDVSQGHLLNNVDDNKSGPVEQGEKDFISWSVLDIGTGNGLLLQELAKQGFSDLTGTDYTEGAINLAQSLADHDGFTNINFLVDDVLETKLEMKHQLVMDKGTLDAIGFHPDGPIKRITYWDSVSLLVVPGGIFVNIVKLKGKKLGLYFSASWCAPCQQFTPNLIEVYNQLSSKRDFEIILVAANRHTEPFNKYFAKMPWLAIPFSDSEKHDNLEELFDVMGIPHLVIIDEKGKILTDKGIDIIVECRAEGSMK